MKPRTRVALLIPLLLWTGTAGAQPPVQVKTIVSKTAVWPGDRVIYEIEVRCAPGTDVLVEDLAADRLHVDGADVVETDSALEESTAGRVRRSRYTLASYRVDVPDIRIPAMTLRYFTQAASEEAQLTPAGHVTVPETVIPIRSTLPDTDAVPQPRVPSTLRQAPRFASIATILGIVLIALVILPVAAAAVDLVGRTKGVYRSFSARRTRRRQRLSLEELRALDLADNELPDAFGRLDALVREHLAYKTGIAAHALTPREIRDELEPRTPALPLDDIEGVLSACETARYAPERPAASLWRDALERAESIVGSR